MENWIGEGDPSMALPQQDPYDVYDPDQLRRRIAELEAHVERLMLLQDDAIAVARDYLKENDARRIAGYAEAGALAVLESAKAQR